MQQKILIAGAAGFVGKNLAKRLAKQNELLLIDKNPEVQKMQGQVLDIRTDFNNLVKLLENTHTVYHLANVSRIAPSWKNYKDYYDTNITATQSLLRLSQICGVKNFVYLSSSSVYGNNGSLRQNETDSLSPTNPYAISKMAAEYALKAQASDKQTKLVIARPFNMIGDHMASGPYAMALSKFIEAKQNNSALEIHGSGSQKRDMLHIDDAIDALMLLAEHGQHNEVYNVGSGKNISIKELADMISDQQIHTDPRPGPEYDTLADITKIANLGFDVKIDVRSWTQQRLTDLKL